MGCGSWSSRDYTTYSASVGRTVKTDGSLDFSSVRSVQEVYHKRRIDEEMSPRNVIRECCNSADHPNTKPVILGIDVTGSMGGTAMEVAKTLNPLMTSLYEKVEDVEFAVMGIGDLDYDTSAIQISQFESDVRVAKHLDKIYFEGGGGGNDFESYTAAWYMGSRHCKLDCWGQSRKGIIITIGDEPLNPYLPASSLCNETGDTLQGDVETKDLYREVTEKYDVFHIHVQHGYSSENRTDEVKRSFNKILPKDHFRVCTLNNLKDTLTEIIVSTFEGQQSLIVEQPGSAAQVDSEGFISW